MSQHASTGGEGDRIDSMCWLITSHAADTAGHRDDAVRYFRRDAAWRRVSLDGRIPAPPAQDRETKGRGGRSRERVADGQRQAPQDPEPAA